MNKKIKAFSKTINTEIHLPSSKSVSNRLLIIKALCKEDFMIENISPSDDTDVMLRAFSENPQEVNIGHAGTSMRFLTAYYATQAGERILTGSARMQERPIKILVDALRKLGANIEYAKNEGFPPLKITGTKLSGGFLEIDGSISSQYITALLLVAPILENGLHLKLNGHIASVPYIDMTLRLMYEFGIEYNWKGSEIEIKNQNYTAKNYTVESDWSGASYWYEIACLATDADILLKGLHKNSLQGDSRVAELFEQLSIETIFTSEGAHLQKKKDFKLPFFFECDLTNQPDLAQTFAVTLCMAGVHFRLSGLETLRIKETDRIAALQNELAKFGFVISETKAGVLEWGGQKRETNTTNISIATYKDHRMAMAFAPACLKYENITIEEAEVVTKSYPAYWLDCSVFIEKEAV